RARPGRGAGSLRRAAPPAGGDRVSRAAWALAAALALALAGALLTMDAAQRVRERSGAPLDWSAAEQALRERGDVVQRVALTEAALPQPPATLLVAAPISTEELDAVASFHDHGGRVVVLGDAALAARLGSRIADAPILPANGSVARPVLDAREGAHVLAWSANGTFVDANGDGVADAG